ncbi:hypothetical protein [Leifsonia sp. LS-T14]
MSVNSFTRGKRDRLDRRNSVRRIDFTVIRRCEAGKAGGDNAAADEQSG